MTSELDAEGWLAGARQVVSPNCDDRPPGQPVRLIVVHAISLPPGRFGGDGIERLFTNALDPAAHPYYREIRSLRVSAHFLIRRDGGIVQFVPCGRRAWHAGTSLWRGAERCNDFSIGIEFEGDGEHRFTESQYRRFATLLARLRERHPLRWIAGHGDIAPGRKNDPGPFFDWERVLALPEARGLVRPY